MKPSDSSPQTGQLARVDVLLEALGRRGAALTVEEEHIVFRRRFDQVAVRMIVDDEHLVLHVLQDDGDGPEEWRLSLCQLAEAAVALRRPASASHDEESPT